MSDPSSDNKNGSVTTTGPDAEKAGTKDVTVHMSPSTTSTIVPKNRNCCYRFWNCIFKFFAKDAIYGSFVGPHPVCFVWLCCNSFCKGTCIKPFVLASVATKLMWFIMMLCVIILSCFFIIPFGSPQKGLNIADSFPCKIAGDEGRYKLVNNNLSRNCSEHGGYFMVQRFFFSYELLLFISCLIMINVKSTGKNRKRAKMHHGFWMYKYLILILFMFIFCLGVRVEGGGMFEYIVSWIGHLSLFVFSFVEITLILDLVELFTAKNRASTSDWADCQYWTLFVVIMALNLAILGLIFGFYFHHFEGPYKNSIEWKHVGILIGGLALSGMLLAAGTINCLRKRVKYDGLVQTAFVILYVLILLWTSLGASVETTARPRLYLYRTNKADSDIRPGNKDTYFKYEACLSGFISFFALIYYCFWHGPRSTTAPFSILFDKVFYNKATKPQVPVIPDFTPQSETHATETADTKGVTISPEADNKDASEIKVDTSLTFEKETQKEQEPALEYASAISEKRVFDDEKFEVRYSWCMFYVFMMLGSLSIMMAMTNFFDPWAVAKQTSSYPTLGMKISAAITITFVYIIFTTFPFPKIFPVSPDDTNLKSSTEKVDVEKAGKEETPVDENNLKSPPPEAVTSAQKI